jgi:hypothetical protein
VSALVRLNRSMPQRCFRPLAVSLYGLVCVAAAVSLWPLGPDVRTDDKNRDGRPDVWRMYDRQGQLATMAVDTNFDGRSDVQEYYQRGALVRRESDRDFNDRVDLVQEFDAITRQTVRSVSDVDFDGVADLLVLFQGGRAVYSEWAHGSRPVVLGGHAPKASQRGEAHRLVPLEDPFRAELVVSAVRPGTDFGDYLGLAASSGLPESCRRVASPFASSSDVSDARALNPFFAALVQYSPRGPPVSHLLR